MKKIISVPEHLSKGEFFFFWALAAVIGSGLIPSRMFGSLYHYSKE